MNQSTYLPFVFVLIMLYVLYSNRRVAIAKQIIKKRKAGGNAEMKELAKKFIDKECVISSLNGQFEGIIKEVTDGAILIEKGGKIEAINLDFVIRIREYPRNKNGKKKSVVLG